MSLYNALVGAQGGCAEPAPQHLSFCLCLCVSLSLFSCPSCPGGYWTVSLAGPGRPARGRTAAGRGRLAPTCPPWPPRAGGAWRSRSPSTTRPGRGPRPATVEWVGDDVGRAKNRGVSTRVSAVSACHGRRPTYRCRRDRDWAHRSVRRREALQPLRELHQQPVAAFRIDLRRKRSHSHSHVHAA